MKYSIKKHGVTQSLLNMWRECPTKARTYLAGWSAQEAKASFPLVFGNDFHAGMEKILEHISEAEDDARRLTAIKHSKAILEREVFSDEDREGLAIKFPEEYEHSAYLSEIMVPRFFDEYKNLFIGEGAYKVVQLEEEFKGDYFGLNFPVRGKIDGVLEDKNGNLWILEHKTKSRFDMGTLLSLIPRDLQVIMYMNFVKQKYGKQPVGVLYNVVRRHSLRRKVSESLVDFMQRVSDDVDARRDHYFQMAEIYISETQFKFQLEKLRLELAAFGKWARKRKINDPQHTSQCEAVYGACPYMHFCNSMCKDFSTLEKRAKLFPELTFSEVKK